MELNAGALFGGRYRLLRPLGKGAMGVVWAAKNEGIDREVAIKTIHADAARYEDTVPRFLNEARICGSIRHPGIVDVLDLGQAEDGTPFLVMEMLVGETLDARMERQALAPVELFRVVRDVARTIALAHARGIVHRDLKPANIFLHRGERGEVTKVLDFGISKVLDGSSLTATSTGAILGSPAYMSPEQAGGRGAVDPRADIFALGVILFEGLSGRLPFVAPNANALIVDLATKDAPSLHEVVPGIPNEVADLVSACTKRDPAQRLATATALADALDRILELEVAVELPPPPVATGGAEQEATLVRTALMAQAGTIAGATIAGAPVPPASKRPFVLAAAAGLVLALVGSAWFLGKSTGVAQEPSATGADAVAAPMQPTSEPSAPEPTPSPDVAPTPAPSAAPAPSISAPLPVASEHAPIAKVRDATAKPAPKVGTAKPNDSVYGQFK